jgi:group II intron reverse transcriptase/maturase
MKERMQKTLKSTGYPQSGRTESESYVEVQTFMKISENVLVQEHITKDGLLEQILSPYNLNLAYKRVLLNKGACGVDGMDTSRLLDYLQSHKDSLIASIRSGKYSPNPVRRVEIPKENGQKRQLGIPTVVDRVIQQAISQILSPLYERDFSPNSFGFRPGLGAHKALKRCQEYINQGYEYAVDMDLERFFDLVNHSKLIEILSYKIKDGRVVSLVHKYLQAGAMVNNRYFRSNQGVPQGGPLSPLLSNIMLHELDKELERRGHPFVRYADDLLVFSKSQRGSERALEHITPYIENKLFLKVNREKTKSAFVRDIKFLGYSFYFRKGNVWLCVHPKSVLKLKGKLRNITARRCIGGYESVKRRLKYYVDGWVNYFCMADMKGLTHRIDQWLKRRIRMMIWKQWKRVRTKYRDLLHLGINPSKVHSIANSRQGLWHMANHPIVKIALTDERLRIAGYTFLSDCYSKVSAR